MKCSFGLGHIRRVGYCSVLRIYSLMFVAFKQMQCVATVGQCSLLFPLNISPHYRTSQGAVQRLWFTLNRIFLSSISKQKFKVEPIALNFKEGSHPLQSNCFSRVPWLVKDYSNATYNSKLLRYLFTTLVYNSDEMYGIFKRVLCCIIPCTSPQVLTTEPQSLQPYQKRWQSPQINLNSVLFFSCLPGLLMITHTMEWSRKRKKLDSSTVRLYHEVKVLQ